MGRYAIYYAPPRNTAIWRFGTSWLGRDPETGQDLARPRYDDLPVELIEKHTTSPRRYGFHATIKAPFHLAAGTDEAMLCAAIDRFAGAQSRCTATTTIGIIDGRLGANPEGSPGHRLGFAPRMPSPEVNAITPEVVRTFDEFRAPASAEEKARHRSAGLTPEEEANLERWGYPQVMDTFMGLHLTLTNRLDDELRSRFRVVIERETSAICAEGLSIEGLALFHEPAPGADLRLIYRAPFGDSVVPDLGAPSQDVETSAG